MIILKFLITVGLIYLHYFFYQKAYNAKMGSFKEILFLFLTIVITLIICGIIITTFIDLK